MPELRRVMLVEDDADIAVVVEFALANIGGLEFRHFASGPSALEGFEDANPDLVILDYSMSGMNGAEVFTALRQRERGRDIPILFMTASLMPKHIDSLLELGAAAVLPKPFDPLTLADRLREIWDQ